MHRKKTERINPKVGRQVRKRVGRELQVGEKERLWLSLIRQIKTAWGKREREEKL